jgi:hypothetical protein
VKYSDLSKAKGSLFIPNEDLKTDWEDLESMKVFVQKKKAEGAEPKVKSLTGGLLITWGTMKRKKTKR